MHAAAALAADFASGGAKGHIAEVQPHWIHRLIPGSELVNQFGHKVVSTNRNECHFGLSPGGCTDHPEVWSRMQEFFRAVVGRYKDAPNLGWDVWNCAGMCIPSDACEEREEEPRGVPGVCGGICCQDG